MAEVTLSLENFWTLREQLPLVDARSEGEFAQSHIPGLNWWDPDFTSFNGKHFVIFPTKK